MTWKIYDEVALVEKRCNHCGEVIEYFGPGTPLAQYMYMDLGLRSDSDTSQLRFGLEPYHWHNTPQKNCLYPISSIYSMTIGERQNKIATEVRTTTSQPSPVPEPPKPKSETNMGHAPYREVPGYYKSKRPGVRGRPPSSFKNMMRKAAEEENDEVEAQGNESKDSI